MYHVLSTGITIFLVYLFTIFLQSTGIISRNLFIRFWNYSMAAVFVPAAAMGLFLALQVNYKWNVTFIKPLLKWHVETAIAFTFTAIVHLFRHFSYYFSFYREQKPGQQETEIYAYSSSHISSSLLVTGFVSSCFQLLMIKEIIIIAGGYELITGTFLATWLLGSAAGSYLAGNSNLSDLRKIFIYFSTGLITSLLLLLVLLRLFFEPGETPGYMAGMLFCIFVLLPSSLLTGFTFIRILASGRMIGFSGGKSYSLETAGGVAAGVLISVAGAGIAGTWQLILTVLLVLAAFIFYAFTASNKRTKVLIVIILTIAIAVLLIIRPDTFFRSLILRGAGIEKSEETPYGNISHGLINGEKTLYYDGRPLIWNNSESDAEERVHYAMLQHNNPRKVLVISGDFLSMLPELKKYKIDEVLFLEHDPALLRVSGLMNADGEPKIRTGRTDAFLYLKTTEELFDIILLNLSEPSSLLQNRFYTAEFFSLAHKRLNSGGVFACSPGTGADYFNTESALLYSSIANSLKSSFKYLMPVAGYRVYFVASDIQPEIRITTLLEKRGISNIYVSPDYLSNDILKSKSDRISELLKAGYRSNTLLFPVASYFYQRYYLSRDSAMQVPAIIIIALLFILPVFFTGRRGIAIYSSAFALAGFEITMLIMLQAVAGNMFSLTGLVIASFMAGLAAGSYKDLPLLKGKELPVASSALIVFYIISALGISLLLAVNHAFVSVMLILILSLIPSFLTGLIFRSLVALTDTQGGAKVYSSDMAGAAAGFIILSSITIPLLGIRTSLFLLPCIVFAGLLFGTIRNK